MKVAFRFGLAHTHTHVRFLLVFAGFLFLTLPASISFKSSFCICSPGSFQVRWSFPTLRSSWHGCPNFFATRSPKHMTLAFQQCHLQVCLWREETEAMPHSRLWLWDQRSTHCVPATTTPGFFLDLTFFANSFLLCETVRHDFFQLVVRAGKTTLASSLHHQKRTCWSRCIWSHTVQRENLWKDSMDVWLAVCTPLIWSSRCSGRWSGRGAWRREGILNHSDPSVHSKLRWRCF